ncbi:MAG TPA: 2-oxo acid dehydrogenase subunit E2, partial [Stellaceae bacterium]|nr:2-oxo acid dehydrogenase subunit E2 [Stellaceae bacterium]
MVDLLVPAELEGTKSTVARWLKQVGDSVTLDEPLVELETDKVAMEVVAPSDGRLAEILAAEGAPAAPGLLLGRVEAGAAAAPAASAEPARDSWAHSKGAGAIGGFDPALRLSPAVRKLLLEHGLDPATIKGTGRDGRITRDDVAAAARTTPPPAPLPQGEGEPRAKISPPPLAGGGKGEGAAAGITSVPHDRMRRGIAEHMARSLATAPHVTAVFEADFTAIAAHRAAHKSGFERQGAALTYTAYFVAAAAAAMRAVPAVNSQFHDDRLDLFHDVNIGIGTALGDKGLVVPVIRRCQDLSLLGIAARLTELTR